MQFKNQFKNIDLNKHRLTESTHTHTHIKLLKLLKEIKVNIF